MVVGAEQRVRPVPFVPAPRRRLYWLAVLRRWLGLRYGPVAPHGVLLVVLYALFALLARLISFGRVQRSTALMIIIGLVIALFLLMVGLFVRALWAALRATCGRVLPGSLRTILLATLGAGLCLVTLPRLFSKDVLSYLVYGRAFGAYGLNPYTTNPINMQYDFNFRLIDWHDAVSVYGPVWTLLCTALYKVVHPVATTHIWGYVIGFRLLALAFHLGSVVLVWYILGRLRPREQVAGTIFYAWNPLTLIEFAGNGHNDVVLVFFLLAALAAHMAERRRPALVALCLALSVLTKFITLLIVPAYALLLWRSAPDLRARLIAWGKAAGIGLVACVLLWAPFAAALRHPGFLVTSSAASAYDNSLLELVYWSLRHLFAAVLPVTRSDELANTIVKTLGRLAFVIIWGVLTWRSRTTVGFIHASFWILFAYLVLATPWFWPWYVTWLVSLAPLTGERRATAATFTFSASVLVLYVLWGNQLPYDSANIYPIHNLVAFGLPLLVLWLQLRRGGAEGEPVYASGPTLARTRLPAGS
jgi:hypothetical protein